MESGDSDNSNNNTTIPWIKKLLRILIQDYRKKAISPIPAPYSISIKKLSCADSYSIIKVCGLLQSYRSIIINSYSEPRSFCICTEVKLKNSAFRLNCIHRVSLNIT